MILPPRKDPEGKDTCTVEEACIWNAYDDEVRRLNPPIDPLKMRFKGKRVDNGEWVEGCLVASHMRGKYNIDNFGAWYRVHPDSVELISEICAEGEL